MLRTKFITATLLVSILALSIGCESHAERKQAAQLRWEKATAKAKIPTARGFFDNDKIDDAEKIVTQCLKADPEMPQAHLLMGRIHLARGRLAEAENSLLRTVELDSASDYAWYLLADMALQNNQLAQALEYYNTAMLLEPANTNYITAIAETHAALGDSDSALALLRSKVELFPHKRQLKIAAANILHRMGNTSQAIAMYKQALLLEAGDPDVIEAMAYCYIMSRQWTLAAEMFEKLIADADDARKTDYLQLLAMCCMNAGDYGRVVTYYNNLSVDQRDDPKLWLQMGQAALGTGVPSRALACATRALTLRPAWPDAIALKACAQYLNADYTAAIKTLERITSNKRIGAFAWVMTGRCYQQLGLADHARKAYEKASRLKPESKLLSLLTKKLNEKHKDI